jgi:hypothetical protein
MSAIPTLCANPCETCAKEGLPLLLTRYALMPKELNAPTLSAQVQAAALSQVNLGSTAHYGLRLLRSGYVYVFDEKRNHWDEYFVTADGYLSKLPMRIRALKAQHQPATTFQCARNGAAPLAQYITIRNPKQASKIWLAFSDVCWTDAVFEAHMGAEHRQKHMSCITLAGGKVAAQPQTAALEAMAQLIPECKLEPTAARKQFESWGPHAYNDRSQRVEALLQAAKKVRPDGGAAIVALHDPVGLTMEIAALAEVRLQTFLNHDNVVKPRFAASNIASLEATIKEQAKLAEISAGEQLAQQAEQGPSAYNPNPALWGMPGDPEQAQRWRTHSPASLQKVANAEWLRYTQSRTGGSRFDAQASKAWLDGYDKGLKAFDAQQIAPLIKAHAAWLQQPCLTQHMACNYDPQDLASGAAYTQAVAKMLEHTQDKEASLKLYKQWLEQGDTEKHTNLVLRALGFNQDKLLAEVKKSDAAALDERAFPTDMLLGYFKSGLEKLPPAGKAAMAQLLQTLGAPLLGLMDKLSNGGPASRAVAAVAATAGVQFTRVEVRGTRGRFVQHLMKTIMQLDPTLKVRHNDLGKAVAAQLKLLEVEGLPMTRPDKRQWWVVLDRDALRGAQKGLSGDALAKELAKSIHAGQELPALKAASFHRGISSAHYDGIGTFLGGLVQCFNMTKLVSDYTQGMGHELSEAGKKLALGAMAIAGTFAEATGIALKAMQDAGKLKNALGFSLTEVPDVLKRWGKRLGLVAGVLVGVIDLVKSTDEWGKGDMGLAFAYVGTGFLGIGLSVAFYFSSALGPIGWLLVGLAVVVLFVVTAWIEKNKDNKVQEWLSRCHFGSNKAERYKTHQEELQQLQLAFA